MLFMNMIDRIPYLLIIINHCQIWGVYLRDYVSLSLSERVSESSCSPLPTQGLDPLRGPNSNCACSRANQSSATVIRDGTFVVADAGFLSQTGVVGANSTGLGQTIMRSISYTWRGLGVGVGGRVGRWGGGTAVHPISQRYYKCNFIRHVFLNTFLLVPCILILQNYVTLKFTHRVAIETPVLRILGVLHLGMLSGDVVGRICPEDGNWVTLSGLGPLP